MTVETVQIHVAKPCRKCGVLPEMLVASGWQRVMCPVCKAGIGIARGSMNEAIGKWNEVMEHNGGTPSVS